MKEPKRKIAGAKQFVNAETGEVLNLQEIIEYYGDNEPWQRVRVAPLMALLDRGISHSKMKVIHWVVEHLDRENNLIYTQRHIADQTQVAKSTINELFKFLLDSNFMKKKGSVYHINPYFIGPKACSEQDYNAFVIRYKKMDSADES